MIPVQNAMSILNEHPAIRNVDCSSYETKQPSNGDAVIPVITRSRSARVGMAQCSDLRTEKIYTKTCSQRAIFPQGPVP